MVRRAPFPEEVAALGLLEDVRYRDAYVAPITAEHSAEEWMRLAVDSAPAALRAGIRGAQTLLGLRLQQPSHDHPLGWTILRSEPDIFILGAEGTGGAARLVGIVGEDRLTFTTQAQFGLRTRVLWTVVQYPHRAIVRYLIGKAVRRAESRRSSPAR